MDFGIEKNSAYFVMELLNGPTCEDEVVRAGAFTPVRATTVVRAVLSALAAAHGEGIIHRDVKPHNVVLHAEKGREVPKLLDFGIAKTAAEREEEALMGSGAYIAPERIRGKPYDGRADVYGTGLVLYRLLTGSLPFDYDVDDFENIAKWHLHGNLPPPSSKVDGLSPAIDKCVARLLARDPLQRPTAEEAEALVEQLVWDMSL
jgi:serine/threonine-protein kinase